MINIVLDNNYWTGLACKIGKYQNGIDVISIPNENDTIKQKAYKFENNRWFFDEQRYLELLEEEKTLQNKIKSSEEYSLNKQRLNQLSEDIIQSSTGIYIADIEAKKAEFIEVLNKVRIYEGKQPKSMINKPITEEKSLNVEVDANEEFIKNFRE